MVCFASTQVSNEPRSSKAAQSVAEGLKAAFGEQPIRGVLVYATMGHDQKAVLRGLREVLGSDVPLIGCSVQGVVSRGSVRDATFVLGVMGFGGPELQFSAAMQTDVQIETAEKGRRLALALNSGLKTRPTCVVVVYDPVCGADVERLLSGMNEHLDCPIVGGGAGQPWGPVVRTHQYFGDEVLTRGAIAFALGGPIGAEIGVSHGTSPTGVAMTLTRCDGNRLLELDGRPAVDIWCEMIGCTDEQINDHDYVSNWAVGVEQSVHDSSGEEESVYFIRAAFGFDLASRAIVVQASIPEGTRIMFHHRAVPVVTQGTELMARELSARLHGRKPWAALGFECAARTTPFLGAEGTLGENVALQKVVAPEAPWLGMLAWGEIAPVGGKVGFHNYTYPLLLLTEH